MYVSPTMAWGRVDKPELPFKDIRVRQALNLAVNKQEIIDNYYKGEAEMLGVPWPPAYTKIYNPLEQMPEEVKELFTYNPDKAKKLLAEAGYPKGFRTRMVLSTDSVDHAAMIVAYFAKIGVDVELQPKEAAVWTSITRNRTHEEMILKGISDYINPSNMDMVRTGCMDNPSYFHSDLVMETYLKINQLLGRSEANDQEINRLLKPIAVEALKSAVGVWMPSPLRYQVWWPWVKNYRGEWALGYGNRRFQWQYIWIDTALKKSMGY